MKPSPIALVRPRRPARKVPPILPPLKLYRSILRAHRRLPAFQRLLGDQYVKSEFHAHKDIDNPLHIVGFLTSWQDYLKAITEDTWREAGLTQDQLNKMSPEQVGQVSIDAGIL